MSPFKIRFFMDS